MAGQIRYRRTSVRTLLGITKEEKKLKRELGITALLKPFRWWGNEKRDVKRELGYYSPEAKLVRHVPRRWLGNLIMFVACLLGATFALGWMLASNKPSAAPDAGLAPSAARPVPTSPSR